MSDNRTYSKSNDNNKIKSSGIQTTSSNVKENNFRQQKMIRQFAQTLICIVLICILGFVKDAIRQEKGKKREISEIQTRIKQQNDALEREAFLKKHEQFMQTFLEYKDRCNKIHSLIYRNPGEISKVTDSAQCDCYAYRANVKRIVNGDRTSLNFALLYVFFATLVFLLVRAIIDVSKDMCTPHDTSMEKLTLHDYASTSSYSRRSSAIVFQRRESKLFHHSFFMSFDHHQESQELTNQMGQKRASFGSTNGLQERLCSIPGHLFKGNQVVYH